MCTSNVRVMHLQAKRKQKWVYWYQYELINTTLRSVGAVVTETYNVLVVYLVYEDGATQASSAGLAGLVKRTVISNYHHVNSHTLVTGLLRSQSKVEAVTGVILHNQEDPRGSWGRTERFNWEVDLPRTNNKASKRFC